MAASTRKIVVTINTFGDPSRRSQLTFTGSRLMARRRVRNDAADLIGGVVPLVSVAVAVADVGSTTGAATLDDFFTAPPQL